MRVLSGDQGPAELSTTRIPTEKSTASHSFLRYHLTPISRVRAGSMKRTLRQDQRATTIKAQPKAIGAEWEALCLSEVGSTRGSALHTHRHPGLCISVFCHHKVSQWHRRLNTCDQRTMGVGVWGRSI